MSAMWPIPHIWLSVSFFEAYKEGGTKNLNEFSVTEMISVMSVFIMDFLTIITEVNYVFQYEDAETQYMISAYSDFYRSKSMS